MPTGTEFDDIENKRTEFLLADHKRFAELFCRTEDIGDKRVDTLVKLVTATVAAFVALLTVSPEEQVLSLETLTLITVAAMVALYLFGIVTYVGVVRGNEAVNRWKVRLDMIRKVFKGELRFEEYEPFHGDKIPKAVKETFEDRIAGGRSPIVTVITVGMGGASAGLLAYWFTSSLVNAFVVLVFVGALSVLLLYSIRKILVAHSRDEKRHKDHVAEHSEQITKLHTATHLLQAALRKVLGGEVTQNGSNITEDRLRFDFTFSRKLTPDEIEEVERLVNDVINQDLEVRQQLMQYDEAIKRGALAFFKENYGETVSVYSVGDFSLELCGGPHVERTGSLGRFKIGKQKKIGAGIVRLRATVENTS